MNHSPSSGVACRPTRSGFDPPMLIVPCHRRHDATSLVAPSSPRGVALPGRGGEAGRGGSCLRPRSGGSRRRSRVGPAVGAGSACMHASDQACETLPRGVRRKTLRTLRICVLRALESPQESGSFRLVTRSGVRSGCVNRAQTADRFTHGIRSGCVHRTSGQKSSCSMGCDDSNARNTQIRNVRRVDFLCPSLSPGRPSGS